MVVLAEASVIRWVLQAKFHAMHHCLTWSVCVCIALQFRTMG